MTADQDAQFDALLDEISASHEWRPLEDEAYPTVTEYNDVGRDLAHWPRGWWVAPLTLITLLLLGAVGVVVGVIVVAELLGPRW